MPGGRWIGGSLRAGLPVLSRSRRWRPNDGRYQARSCVLRRLIWPYLRFGPRTARWRQQQGFGVSTRPTQHRRAIWALPTPATRETGSVGTREKKQKKRPLPRPLALGRLRILSGPKKARSRGPAAGNPHITRSRERAESSKTNPLQTQASRVEPAARRLLVSSGPARAAATSKEWEAGRRRRRCCR